jgi:dCMP deaminase
MRPDFPEYFMAMAVLVSSRGTCGRRRVGCVLTDKHNHVIATGYNGVAKGAKHCTDEPCAGRFCTSGTGLDLCEAIHAEANALLQCRDTQSIVRAFCTASPCVHCVKLLLNTSCQEIFFLEEYPHSDAQRLWESQGRLWTQVKIDMDPLQNSTPILTFNVLALVDLNAEKTDA